MMQEETYLAAVFLDKNADQLNYVPSSSGRPYHHQYQHLFRNKN